MIENRSAPGGAIVPSLIYDDVGQAVEWLCRVFGFRERLRVGGNNPGHAQLTVGQGGILLGQSRKGQGFADDDAEMRTPRPGEVSQTLMVRVEDVDAHFRHAQECGARILQSPVTQMYGERQYTVVDLAGYRWTFSQPVTDVNPEDWGATVTDLNRS